MRDSVCNKEKKERKRKINTLHEQNGNLKGYLKPLRIAKKKVYGGSFWQEMFKGVDDEVWCES